MLDTHKAMIFFFKGKRYHFHLGSKPTSYQEIFNHIHSSLKSVIERTFWDMEEKAEDFKRYA